MDLREWLFHNKLSVHKFAKRYGLNYQTVLSTANKEKTPRLNTALLIHAYTSKQVPIEELQTAKDKEKYETTLGIR